MSKRHGLVALATASALILAACGDDDSGDAAPDGADLRPPVAVEVIGDGMGSAAELSADASTGRDGDDAADSSLLPAYGPLSYTVGEGMPPLPTNAIGYEYPADVDIDDATVVALAEALGVDGEPQRVDEREVAVWRVGPDDGSAPSLWVYGDGQGNWSYSSAWTDADGRYGCAVADSSQVAEGAEGGGVSGTPGSEPVVPDQPVADVPSSAPVEECVEPVPPDGVPSASEAEARAAGLLSAIGLDPAAYEFETYADEWFASVNAMPVLDGVASPIGTGFGFGANGVLEWAGGSLATPIATGPYPLIGLDEAVARLNEQMVYGPFARSPLADGDVSVAVDDAIASSDGADATDALDQPVEDAPAETVVEPTAVEPPQPTETVIPSEASVDQPTVVDPAQPTETVIPPDVSVDQSTVVDPAQPTETVYPPDVSVDQPEPRPLPDEQPVDPEPVVVVLVDVRPGFWWVFDASGSTWLLPAYTFVDTDGGAHTVAAVTDEFMIQDAPVSIEPLPPDQVDPPADVSASAEVVIGLTVDEAMVTLERLGLSMRVARQDGEDLAMTDDFVDTRVNVVVDEGVVTEVLFVG